ncbi:MAG: hypothetical protein Q8R07_03520 [Candidatus Uhrbacteria bacterium]|nr:hypothetical protein [Candidatus Uhrbacteria bacterium]
MAEKKFEQDDPFEMVGVVLPEAMDDDALTEMACCFVEELARMGYGCERLMRVFRDPFYKGPHAVYRSKGEEFVRALVDQVPALETEGRDG